MFDFFGALVPVKTAGRSVSVTGTTSLIVPPPPPGPRAAPPAPSRAPLVESRPGFTFTITCGKLNLANHANFHQNSLSGKLIFDGVTAPPAMDGPNRPAGGASGSAPEFQWSELDSTGFRFQCLHCGARGLVLCGTCKRYVCWGSVDERTQYFRCPCGKHGALGNGRLGGDDRITATTRNTSAIAARSAPLLGHASGQARLAPPASPRLPPGCGQMVMFN